MSLDPENWSALRAAGHRLVDELFDDLATLRDRPVWTPMPEPVRQSLSRPIGGAPEPLDAILADITDTIRPYLADNRHPRFAGWVQGGGNPVGVLAEIVAAGLNANCGGRDHAPLLVERQVIAWSAAMLGMPPETSGVLVTGTSIANFIAVTVARVAHLPHSRRDGTPARLTGYATAAAHGCVPRAFDLAGLGTAALRLVDADAQGRMDPRALRAAVAADRASGLTPFLLVGTAGGVDTGVIDDLAALADAAAELRLWFHVDAAFGAFGMLAPSVRPRLAGIGRADSVAFDFHKWAQVPYDAGCVLVRDPEAHRAAFATSAAYLRRDARGLGRGETWPTDLGPDLSRGFRALKVWMTLRAYGDAALGAVVEQCCAVARAMATRIAREPVLELRAPVSLNIVCFRATGAPGDIDSFNADIAADVQESGRAVISTTTVGGALALRAAIVNHRATEADGMAIIDAVLDAARSRLTCHSVIGLS